MRGVSVLFLLGIYTTWSQAQFLNNRPFPTYSLENMPDTAFSCREKILGGYYADVDAQCQMFHVCVKVAGVGVQDFRFLCPNGTAFDQDHQICADWEDVDCDATTLYYSSDNFDLYRIGSGFESKAKKYGEDEEAFALQRAETGDVRINREHQSQRVNQRKEPTYYKKPQSVAPKANGDNDRDIFKGSSSSNFFNNRNGGKETDDDYDDNVNINQYNDQNQKRKFNRNLVRRPNSNNQQQETTPATSNKIKQSTVHQRERESQTARPQRPTGFINNFAGSSYVPTSTSKSTTVLSNERYTIAVNNHRSRNNHRHRAQLPDYNKNTDDLRHVQTTREPLTISTPAPFRQAQHYNNPPARQAQFNNRNDYETTTLFFNKQTTQNFPKNGFNNHLKKTSNDEFEIKKSAKESSLPFQNPKPTTYSPRNVKPYYQTTTKTNDNYPTTFSPKTNKGYNTISQVTTQYNSNNQNNQKTSPSNQFNDNQKTSFQPYNQQYNTPKPQFNNPQPFSNQKQNLNTPSSQPFSTKKNENLPANYNQFDGFNSNNQQGTPKSTLFTQYTPTVPKISSTTPVSKSNRYDETQYDDGSYNPKYDYNDRREDEFLKTAHSQNIAKSRNDLAQSQKSQERNKQTDTKTFRDSPRPFSVTPNSQKIPDYSRPAQPVTQRYNQFQQQEKQQQQPQSIKQKYNSPPPASSTTLAPKKAKDVSYDYAYYDTNGSEPEYDIEHDIKKSTAKTSN